MSAKVKGAVEIDTGDGDNQNAFGAKTLTVGKGVTIKSGTGGDVAELFGTSLTIGGPVLFETGAGQDTLRIAATKVAIKGGVIFSGGDDADIASILTNGQISGAVEIDLGSSDDGDQLIEIGANVSIPGLLTLGSTLLATGAATDSQASGYTSSFTGAGIAVKGAVTIDLSANTVDTVVSLENFTARAALSIATGTGFDTVSYEQADSIGFSTVAKLATIQTGAGEDTILIGKSTAKGSHNTVKFLGGLQVDGGANNDTSNLFTSPTVNTFAKGFTPTTTNIESTV